MDMKLGKTISINPASGDVTATLSDGTPTSDLNLTGPAPVSKGEAKS
jgi:hypothetical protein